MKFVGTIIIYAYLQAVGAINSHESICFLNTFAAVENAENKTPGS